jgi:hypothetical protein
MTHPQVTGPMTNETTELAKPFDGDKTMWLINAGAMTVQEAVSNLGLTPHVLLQTDEHQLWNDRLDAPTMTTALSRLARPETRPKPR